MLAQKIALERFETRVLSVAKRFVPNERTHDRGTKYEPRMFRLMIDLFAGLNGKIADLDKEIARGAREDEVSRRLMTVPAIGPRRHRDRRPSTASRDLRQGPRLCRLAGCHASSTIDRRQAEAWRDIQGGRTHAQAPTHHRQQRRRATGEQTRRAKGIVA
jgi:hypothetical protein